MKIKLRKQQLLLGITFVLITACASNSEKTVDNNEIDMPANIKLPISAQKWTTWHCQNGADIQTRFLEKDGRQLKLRYREQEQILKRQLSSYPAIYENPKIAFFSDGKTSVVGAPRSNIIYAAGCKH